MFDKVIYALYMTFVLGFVGGSIVLAIAMRIVTHV